MKRKTTAFVLCRSTSKSNRCAYLGHVVLAGKLYAIEADVVEYDVGDGTKAKRFEGQVFGGQDLVRNMLKGAKVSGERSAIPKEMLDLVEQAEELDDSDKLDLIGSEAT